MAHRVLFGAFGSCSGTELFPWPTNTPGPTFTDDLLPTMTPGCGDEFDRVPSGQTMASPDSTPRRPSSQVTTGPSLVADLRRGRSSAAHGDHGEENSELQHPAVRHVVLPTGDLRFHPSSPVTGFRFKVAAPENLAPTKMPNYQYYSIGWGNSHERPPRSLAKVLLPLQERASGEMAEWLKAHAWKACVRETVPWVRIPLSPPANWFK
jgi:hypothetical protein